MHVLLGDQVALQEALGKQQQINARSICMRSEVVDDSHRSVHVAEDLRRLARADPQRVNLSGSSARVSHTDWTRG